MQFEIEKYSGKYVMHCRTREEAEDFCSYLHSIGRKWCDGESYLEATHFDDYKEDTIYYFNEGTFCELSYAKNDTKNYTILEWSDYMVNNKACFKKDLRTGDVVLRRDGDVEIVNRKLNMFISKDGWSPLDSVSEDLISNSSFERDIVEVRRPKTAGDCIFSAFELRRGELIFKRPKRVCINDLYKYIGEEVELVNEDGYFLCFVTEKKK